jgi:hypothetical protein
MEALLTDLYRGFSIDIKYTDLFQWISTLEIFVHVLFELINRTPAICRLKNGRTTYFKDAKRSPSIA